MSKFLRLFLGPVLILLVSAPIVILILSLQTGPVVSADPSLSAGEIGQIEQLLLESAPESPAAEGLHQVHLNENELNLLLRYSVDVMNLAPDWAARLSLADDAFDTELSVRITHRLVPLYVNVRGEFTVTDGQLSIAALHIGKLQIPDRFLRYAIEQVRQELENSGAAYTNFSDLLAQVQQVQVNTSGMDVELNWDPTLISRIGNDAQQMFISEADQQRIMAHYRRIADVTTTIPADLRAVSLTTFIAPLFTSALEISQAGGDPVAENRTLLQALAVYVNDDDIAHLIGPDLAGEITAPNFIEVRLQRRQDLAQHLVSIAAISASAGADIASMLSTTKEAYDARYRSGFSFSDLTANTVGVTLATLATQSPESAVEMQRRLSRVQNESDYMPIVGGSRDGLSESDFTALYENRNSEEYQQRLEEIRQLIEVLPVFLGLAIDEAAL